LQKRFGSGARAKASAVAERAVFIMTASPGAAMHLLDRRTCHSLHPETTDRHLSRHHHVPLMVLAMPGDDDGALDDQRFHEDPFSVES
jgi:hypothetical protein